MSRRAAAFDFRVNLMIVGAQKCGTSALASFLATHPAICIPAQKEVHLFDAPDYSSGWDQDTIDARYGAAIPDWRGQRWVCDATPIYIYWPEIAAELSRFNAALKLIVLLRDPVERALSHYRMERGRKNEALGPIAAFTAEPWRLARDRGNRAERSSWRVHSYQDRGLYRRQLANLQRSFPRDQVLVVRAESLWARHEETLRSVYAFLDVPPPPELPPRARVFAGDSARPSRGARALLRLRLGRESAWLERALPEGGPATRRLGELLDSTHGVPPHSGSGPARSA
jgi:hypothetical protein